MPAFDEILALQEAEQQRERELATVQRQVEALGSEIHKLKKNKRALYAERKQFKQSLRGMIRAKVVSLDEYLVVKGSLKECEEAICLATDALGKALLKREQHEGTLRSLRAGLTEVRRVLGTYGKVLKFPEGGVIHG